MSHLKWFNYLFSMACFCLLCAAPAFAQNFHGWDVAPNLSDSQLEQVAQIIEELEAECPEPSDGQSAERDRKPESSDQVSAEDEGSGWNPFGWLADVISSICGAPLKVVGPG